MGTDHGLGQPYSGLQGIFYLCPGFPNRHKCRMWGNRSMDHEQNQLALRVPGWTSFWSANSQWGQNLSPLFSVPSFLAGSHSVAKVGLEICSTAQSNLELIATLLPQSPGMLGLQAWVTVSSCLSPPSLWGCASTLGFSWASGILRAKSPMPVVNLCWVSGLGRSSCRKVWGWETGYRGAITLKHGYHMVF